MRLAFVKQVQLRLSVLTTKQKQNNNKAKERNKETYEGHEYVYYLDCGGANTSVCPNSLNCINPFCAGSFFFWYTTVPIPRQGEKNIFLSQY